MIGVAAAISTVSLVHAVVSEGNRLKDLRTQQKEALALQELLELQTEKVKELEVFKNNPKLLNTFYDKFSQEHEGPKKSDVKLRIKNVFERIPESIIPLTGNILSANSTLSHLKNGDKFKKICNYR